MTQVLKKQFNINTYLDYFKNPVPKDIKKKTPAKPYSFQNDILTQVVPFIITIVDGLQNY